MIYILVIFGIFSCSASQILLKWSANKNHTTIFFELFNIPVLLSYLIFLGALIINIWAMNHGILLKEIAILESLGYVFVPFLSWFFLKENISINTLGAILMIIIGIIVFYI